jgi:hypothetical protein
MKKITITKVSAQTRVANLMASKIRGAVSIFSDAPTVEQAKAGTQFLVIEIIPAERHSWMLTFAEIDTVREVVAEFEKKYHGITYYMTTRPYLADDNKTWLSKPVMTIDIQRFDEDIFKDMK